MTEVTMVNEFAETVLHLLRLRTGGSLMQELRDENIKLQSRVHIKEKVSAPTPFLLSPFFCACCSKIWRVEGLRE